MIVIRPSSYEEYISWYLRREHTKRGKNPDEAPSFPTVQSMRDEMTVNQHGKLRPFFEVGKWHIVVLNSKDDINNLVCLEGGWTKAAGLLDFCDLFEDVRTLSVFTAQAKTTDYFGDKDALGIDDREFENRQRYLRKFRKEWPVFTGEDRITLRTLDDTERRQNPNGTYYLHDGLGRLLPYSYLIENEGREFTPIEAFLVEEPPS